MLIVTGILLNYSNPAVINNLASIASPTHGWLLHLLPAPLSRIAVAWLSSHCAITSHSASLGPLVWLIVALPPTCPAGCCIASPHTTTSHLMVPLPIIAPLTLVMPLSMPSPLAPLVWLFVVSPLLTPPPPICWSLCLSLPRRLSLCHGLPCLLSGWLCIASPHAAASHLPAQCLCLCGAIALLSLSTSSLSPAIVDAPALRHVGCNDRVAMKQR